MRTRKGKNRNDGSPVYTYRYTCSGYRTKGRKVCGKVLIDRDSLEQAVLRILKGHVEQFLEDGGRERLRAMIRELLVPSGEHSKSTVASLRKKLKSLDEKADALLDTISPANRDFIDQKLVRIAREREQIQNQIAEIEAFAAAEIDAEKATDEILEGMAEFEKVIAEGSPEDRKLFARAFIEEITIHPDEPSAELVIKKVPQLPHVGESHGSFVSQLVAGTGYKVKKTNPLGRFRTRVPLIAARSEVLRVAA
jgi:hypothetical protein